MDVFHFPGVVEVAPEGSSDLTSRVRELVRLAGFVSPQEGSGVLNPKLAIPAIDYLAVIAEFVADNFVVHTCDSTISCHLR